MDWHAVKKQSPARHVELGSAAREATIDCDQWIME